MKQICASWCWILVFPCQQLGEKSFEACTLQNSFFWETSAVDFFFFWPFRCRQGKIVFLLFYAIFCVAVSRKIFWIVIWWVNIFFKKSDLFISSSVYFSLKRKGRKKEANWYDCAWWQAMEMIWNQKCYLQTSRLKQCRWPFPSC